MRTGGGLPASVEERPGLSRSMRCRRAGQRCFWGQWPKVLAHECIRWGLDATHVTVTDTNPDVLRAGAPRACSRAPVTGATLAGQFCDITNRNRPHDRTDPFNGFRIVAQGIVKSAISKDGAPREDAARKPGYLKGKGDFRGRL